MKSTPLFFHDSGTREAPRSQTLHTYWRFRQAGTETWMPASVPGCNHLDLLANGKIEDPFWRTHEADLQWIDKEDWEYELRFDVTAELPRHDRVELCFEGLDTHAEVTLNGTVILRAENMFREWRMEVKDRLLEGENRLHIRFRSPIAVGLERLEEQTYPVKVLEMDQAEHGHVPGGKRVSVFSRKAPYHFGWDWGPRLVSSGIWRPVTLRAWNGARIRDVQMVQRSVTPEAAEYTAVFEVEAERAVKAELCLSIEGEGEVVREVTLRPGIHRHEVAFVIPQPRLWWSRGLGEAYLYTVTGHLRTGSGCDSRSTRLGVRTIRVVREDDERGRTFYFELNGVPVFMKGANLIPLDMYEARVTEERIRQFLQSAADANFNMVRVWGGGIYPSNTFYDVCDELGLLVWQDFMFACNQYPGDRAFLENVRHEVVDTIRRLRNHPSLALWCGNNEMAWFHFKTPEVTNLQQQAYADLFLELIPGEVKRLDPSRFYWHSSPAADEAYGGDGRARRSHGDTHSWGVWHGNKPYTHYAGDIPRFMSEYGFQSFPEVRTIRSFSLPEDFGIHTPVMRHYQRNDSGNDKIRAYMEQHYRMPERFEDFLYVGQLLQADIVRYGIEAHRRAKPVCMGTLYWQHNDVWPVASWSSVDYDLRWKALHYRVGEAYAPQLVSVFKEEETGAVRVHVVNDELHAFDALLRMRVLGFDGSPGWSRELPVRIGSNRSAGCFEIPEAELLDGTPANTRLLAVELRCGERILATALHYFTLPLQLDLPRPVLTHRCVPAAQGYELILCSDVLAKNVYLQAGEDTVFSDNYFDLLPGEEVTVHVKTALDAQALASVFSIRTLHDTYGGDSET